MIQCPEGYFICITLPNHTRSSHCQVNRFVFFNRFGYFQQYTISYIIGIIQTID